MVKPPKAFDVWFLTANTVYKSVPFGVVADWAQQGRLGRTDKVRPAGTTQPWVDVAANEFLADYLRRPAASAVVPVAPTPAVDNSPIVLPATSTVAETAAQPAELHEEEGLTFRRPHGEEDDDVDMIPLIDVSMVLLVFFIIMRAAGAVSPVEVPEMKYAGELRNDPEAITISIEKKDEATVFYSVRLGQASARPEHDLLKTPEEAIRAMEQLLADVQHPPEVRIACRKDLPRERVYEIRRELEPKFKERKINSFTATVMEAPQKKSP